MTRILMMFTALLLTASLEADTITVCAKGCDYADLQAAIDAASSGDIIEIGAGSYGGLISTSTTLTLRGETSGEDLPATYLEYVSRTGGVLTVENIAFVGEGAYGIVTGPNGWVNLTDCHFISSSVGVFFNGGGTARLSADGCVFDGVGRAIDSGSQDCYFEITDCIFRGCREHTVTASGSAVAQANILGCTFEDNDVPVTIANASATTRTAMVISACTFTNNRNADTSGFGGGLEVQGNTLVAIVDCVFRDNDAGFGGAVAVRDGAHVKSSNCTFQDNQAFGFAGAVWADPGSDFAASETLACGNSAPQFYNWTNLGSVTLCASCLDCEAGGGFAADAPCDTGIRGDFNCDGVFNEEDYLAVQASLGICIGDLDGDGQVRAGDLGILLAAWGMCP